MPADLLRPAYSSGSALQSVTSLNSVMPRPRAISFEDRAEDQSSPSRAACKPARASQRVTRRQQNIGVWNAPVDSAAEQLPQSVVNKFDVGAGATRITCKVSPIADGDPSFGVRHMFDLMLTVFGREVEVGRRGHNDCLCLDAGEGLFEIAAILRIAGDVGVLPRPQQ
jgi:hypothetical protein